MDARQFFIQAVQVGGSCLSDISANALANSTPCSEWNLKQLLNHMVYELRWLPDIVAGKTVAEVGTKYDGDLLGDDVQQAWQEAAMAATKTAEYAQLNATAHLSYGDVPVSKYLTECGCDMLIHGWDAAQAIGASLQFPDNLIQAAFNYYQPLVQPEGMPGIFAPPLKVAKDATMQTKLLALVGRKA